MSRRARREQRTDGIAHRGRRVDARLNLGAWQARSRANGPGERFVLWLQGCSLRCPGCANQEFWPLAPWHVLPVDRVAEMILAVEGIEGVTYTGGEPTEQARGLALLSECLRAAGKTIVCYTGRTLESLNGRSTHGDDDPPSDVSPATQTRGRRYCARSAKGGSDRWLKRLLAQIDVLIDGPYVREQAGNLLWRASTNQRVHFLTDAYRHWAAEADCRRADVEFFIDGGRMVTTGNWPEGLLDQLTAFLDR